MADQLYLSVWYPNFQFEHLPAATVGVLRQFARVSGLPKVAAAAAYPVSFSEPPVYQRVYVLDKRAEESKDTTDANIENAVAEAMELLHEDTAYEFEMKWQLWEYEAGEGGLDGIWRRVPKTVKVLAFGPEFDDQTFEQNGLIRVDFGLDASWVFDEDEVWEDEDATGGGGHAYQGECGNALGVYIERGEALRDFKPAALDGERGAAGGEAGGAVAKVELTVLRMDRRYNRRLPSGRTPR